MQRKADCVVAELNYCNRGSPYGDAVKGLLKYARPRAHRLVVISRCASTEVALADLRILAGENIEFPLRYYQDLPIDEVIKREGCSQYEVKSFEEILKLVAP
ncbi:MAG: hypothetical protein TU35_005860 [Thermoproteus sp. AZ2]|jgi:hypothetical protein|uniref:Uncharacterized protein n=1 Tax=Thermoproteus sp. AZ2 TaxID=1609232 RepID=A0ACC6V174_9CREN|nr:MAG: hypothetical protein TU35_01035 [Thermoproteus sp. AZ2]